MSAAALDGFTLLVFYSFLWCAILIYLIREAWAARERLDDAREGYEVSRQNLAAVRSALESQIEAFHLARASYELARNEHEGVRPN